MSKPGTPVKMNLKLLHQLHQCTKLAARHPHIGHQSVQHTEQAIEQHLNRLVQVDRDIVLSALWSAKMLDEMKLLRKEVHIGFYQLVKELEIDLDEFYFWEKNIK